MGRRSRPGAANINFEYPDTASLTVRTGTSSGNVFNVSDTSPTTNIVANSTRSVVNVGAASSVQGITGTLNIQNVAGTTDISIDDWLTRPGAPPR